MTRVTIMNWLRLGASASLILGARAADLRSTLPLATVYQVRAASGGIEWVADSGLRQASLRARQAEPLFQAVSAKTWPPGLIPLFEVEWKGRNELRRRPRPGWENSSEPIFFILPPEDEATAVSRLSGHWRCEATHPDGSQSFFAWELTLDGTNVAGRFDQETEFRFASVTGGHLRDATFSLGVFYSDSDYRLDGTLHGSALSGVWRQVKESRQGTWKATRDETQPSAPSVPIAPLYEWRRIADDSRRYSIEAVRAEPGWERSPRPLGRVWKMP